MALKKRKVTSGGIERKIAIAAIVSKEFLVEMHDKYKPEFIESKSIGRVIDWVIKYYERYKEAPGKHIEDIYYQKAEKIKSGDEKEEIEKVLERCSKEYSRLERFNLQYYIDMMVEYFQARAMTLLCYEAIDNIEESNILQASALIAGYKAIQSEADTAANPLTDAELIYRSFENVEQPIISFAGPFGERLRDVLCRDNFLAILAPEKRGKTWMLQEFALAGLKARCNTVLFSIGDMSTEQLTVRHHIRLNKKSNRRRYCGELWIPTLDCKKNQDNSCNKRTRKCEVELGIDADDLLSGEFEYTDADPEYIPCARCQHIEPTFWYTKREPVEPLSWREAYKTGHNFFERMVGRQYKIKSYPNGTVNVADLEAQLDIWEEQEDFVADLIIVDYMDLFAPEYDAPKDYRQSINHTWKAFRRMTQRRHVLGISATQADAAAYGQDRLNESNFSEDKRKIAHVTGMIGLNQSPIEKRLGLMRINEIVMRESDFLIDREIKILQSLATGQPLIASFI